MKKLIALLLTLIMLTLASCEYMPEQVQDVIQSKKVHTVSFTAGYDYGFHQKDRATLLLDYCSVFFDADEWGIGRINAGDVITVKHRGDLLIQETYPGTVVTKGVEILDISASRADVIELTAVSDGDTVTLSSLSDEPISLIPTNTGTEASMIISEDNSFMQLSPLHVGMKIYATGKLEGSFFTVSAYYGFNPEVTK